MNNNEVALNVINELFESAIDEVFSSLGCTFKKVTHAGNVESVHSAHIEASSDDLSLFLILRGPVSLLQKTYPVDCVVEKLNTDELDDWILELANRFMGSFKNSLIPYQHTLKLGIPTKEFGFDINQLSSDEFQSDIFHFDVGYEIFEIGLYTKLLNENLSFVLDENIDDSDTNDGELEFF